MYMDASSVLDPKAYYLDLLSMLRAPEADRETIALTLVKTTYGLLYKMIGTKYPALLGISPILPPHQYITEVIGLCGQTQFAAYLMTAMKDTTRAYLTELKPGLTPTDQQELMNQAITGVIGSMAG